MCIILYRHLYVMHSDPNAFPTCMHTLERSQTGREFVDA